MSHPKTPKTRHHTGRIEAGAPTYDVYEPFESAHIEREPIVIVGGMASLKKDYKSVARRLAVNGVVIDPDYDNPMPGSENMGALESRAYTLNRTLEEVARLYGAECVKLFEHSLGAPTGAEAHESSPLEIASVDMVCPAAFEPVGPSGIWRLPNFYVREVLPQSHRFLPFVMDAVSDPWAALGRLNPGRRIREVKALWDLDEDFMTNYLRALKTGDAMVRCFVGPQDRLTYADAIREAAAPIIGEENVIDIHPEAAHLAPQMHYGRMAKLILGQYVDGQYVTIGGDVMTIDAMDKDFAIAS